MILGRTSYVIAAILLVLSFTSCVNTRPTRYFADQASGPLPSNLVVPETIINPNDLLGITVTSLNPQASAVFNLPSANYTNTNSQEQIQANGYVVSTDGFIQFPVLGKIKASGLTENALAANITKTLTDRKLLTDPIVIVRYLNFKVTVLGEVARPTVINVPTQKITLLEALGMAGDITVFGKKNNVMIIRDEGGQRTLQRLDLNSSEIFQSPYYFLKTNDIVYVEANKARVASSGRAVQVLPIVFGGLSFLAIVLDRAFR